VPSARPWWEKPGARAAAGSLSKTAAPAGVSMVAQRTWLAGLRMPSGSPRGIFATPSADCDLVRYIGVRRPLLGFSPGI
jgi:hypothetical protein